MAKTTQDPIPAQGLIDREKLAARFCCSIETIKRMEKRGFLKRVQLGERMVRYRMSDILKLEGVERA
jgi:predicted DNA-binding transcriptional regulator AlpA